MKCGCAACNPGQVATAPARETAYRTHGVDMPRVDDVRVPFDEDLPSREASRYGLERQSAPEDLTELLRKFYSTPPEGEWSRAEPWPDAPIPAFLDLDGRRVSYRKPSGDKPVVIDLSHGQKPPR